MSTFGEYAAVYNLMYQDKNYVAEAEFVGKAIGDVKGRELLEVGCGTGRHAELFADAGWSVTGIDRSEGMLESARLRSSERAAGEPGRVRFEEGDACSYRGGRQFDAVISLFHVMSYQTSGADVRAAFATAAAHLQRGGLFAFDFWYGPAVLWQRPAVRVKRLRDQQLSVVRVAEPVVRDLANTVDVHYTLYVEDLLGGGKRVVEELHRMRYFFMPEIDDLLAGAGMRRRSATEWLTGREPSVDTWGVFVVAERV